MTTDNLSNLGSSADGSAVQNPAPAHGGLWKVGIAAAIVAASALVFVSGCGKRNSRSSRSSGGDSSSEQDRREAGGSSGLKAGDTKTFTLPGGVEMEMVYVAPGSFTMGSPESEEEHEEDEKQHRVTLTEGFWIGKYPVTQRQWQTLVRASGVSFAKGKPVPYFSRDGKGRDFVGGLDTSDFPMENISWNDCRALVDALNRNERGEWRWSLPTEAQWEFAARGGTRSRGYTYSGGNDLDALGWYYENSGLERLSDSDCVRAVEKGDLKILFQNLSSNKCRTHSVKEKNVGNELGIVGMSGNVAEWCADWYGNCLEGSVTDPRGPASGDYRVLRGGSWGDDARNCRSTSRSRIQPGFRYYIFGFRLCCSAGPRGEAESGGRVTETPPKRSGLMGLALIGGLGVQATGKSGRDRNVGKAQQSVNALAEALGRYKFHCGVYPTAEEGLEALVLKHSRHAGWVGPYISSPNFVPTLPPDPWKRPFVYEPTNEPPVLLSLGPDGKRDTADDIVPEAELFSKPFRDTTWTNNWVPYHQRGILVVRPPKERERLIKEGMKEP